MPKYVKFDKDSILIRWSMYVNNFPIVFTERSFGSRRLSWMSRRQPMRVWSRRENNMQVTLSSHVLSQAYLICVVWIHFNFLFHSKLWQCLLCCRTRLYKESCLPGRRLSLIWRPRTRHWRPMLQPGTNRSKNWRRRSVQITNLCWSFIDSEIVFSRFILFLRSSEACWFCKMDLCFSLMYYTIKKHL